MKYKFILLFFLYSTTISFSQKECKSFYIDYGLHLFAKGEIELGIKYLHKADSCGFLYGSAYAKIISNPFNYSDEYILNIWEKLVLSYGEEANFEEIIKDYPDVLYVLMERQLEEKAKNELKTIVAKIRSRLDFKFYTTIKNLRYLDQSHRGRNKITKDLETRKRIDSIVLMKLYDFLIKNEIPDIYEMGSARKNITIILIHNARSKDSIIYNKVMEIVDILDKTVFWNPSTWLLYKDEQLRCNGKKPIYGQAMARMGDNNTIYFDSIKNIEHIDSIRLANYLLPFQFRITQEEMRPYYKGRTVIVPEGYVFDENWKDKCRCPLIE